MTRSAEARRIGSKTAAENSASVRFSRASTATGIPARSARPIARDPRTPRDDLDDRRPEPTVGLGPVDQVLQGRPAAGDADGQADRGVEDRRQCAGRFVIGITRRPGGRRRPGRSGRRGWGRAASWPTLGPEVPAPLALGVRRLLRRSRAPRPSGPGGHDLDLGDHAERRQEGGVDASAAVVSVDVRPGARPPGRCRSPWPCASFEGDQGQVAGLLEPGPADLASSGRPSGRRALGQPPRWTLEPRGDLSGRTSQSSSAVWGMIGASRRARSLVELRASTYWAARRSGPSGPRRRGGP